MSREFDAWFAFDAPCYAHVVIRADSLDDAEAKANAMVCDLDRLDSLLLEIRPPRDLGCQTKLPDVYVINGAAESPVHRLAELGAAGPLAPCGPSSTRLRLGQAKTIINDAYGPCQGDEFEAGIDDQGRIDDSVFTGDTLALYIARELTGAWDCQPDDVAVEELIGVLETARTDLAHVLAALRRYQGE